MAQLQSVSSRMTNDEVERARSPRRPDICDEEILEFSRRNGLDEKCIHDLLELSPQLRARVLSEGDIGSKNPNACATMRIKYARKAEQTGNMLSAGRPEHRNSRAGHPTSDAHLRSCQQFAIKWRLDQPAAATFLDCSAEIQRAILDSEQLMVRVILLHSRPLVPNNIHFLLLCASSITICFISKQSCYWSSIAASVAPVEGCQLRKFCP